MSVLKRHRTGDYAEQAEHWYVEPEWCWQVLFGLVGFRGTVLDPACGGGTGLRCCASAGIPAVGSDIVDRGAGAVVADFLSDDYPLRASNVICNPPFRHAVEFAWKGLGVARRKVALLVPLPFLASQRRYRLFTASPVSQVIVLSRRPSMPPGGEDIRPTGGKEDYCWIVWTHGHVGPPTVAWGKP